MFESLDDTMKHDDKASTSTKDRVILWVSVAVITVVVVGGLYFGISSLEG
jgi:hypothetical protein